MKETKRNFIKEHLEFLDSLIEKEETPFKDKNENNFLNTSISASTPQRTKIEKIKEDIKFKAKGLKLVEQGNKISLEKINYGTSKYKRN